MLKVIDVKGEFKGIEVFGLIITTRKQVEKMKIDIKLEKTREL